MRQDELMHYGVKGQKWGVRRYQNADGSLTNAGRKKQAKMEKYRNKLVNKADRKAASNRNSAKRAMNIVKDLKKNGTKSEAYREWKSSTDEERARKYEQKNTFTYTDATGRSTTYSRSYRTSGDRLINDVIDYGNSKQKVKELINENNADAKRYQNNAKQWAKRNKNLMNMDVSELTSKKDIRKVYRGR
jgi:hypothetical protein